MCILVIWLQHTGRRVDCMIIARSQGKGRVKLFKLGILPWSNIFLKEKRNTIKRSHAILLIAWMCAYGLSRRSAWNPKSSSSLIARSNLVMLVWLDDNLLFAYLSLWAARWAVWPGSHLYLEGADLTSHRVLHSCLALRDTTRASGCGLRFTLTPCRVVLGAVLPGPCLATVPALRWVSLRHRISSHTLCGRQSVGSWLGTAWRPHAGPRIE